MFLALSGWNTLAQATRVRLETSDETSRFCTVSLTKRRVFTHLRSFTTVRRQAALVELTLTLFPEWLAPRVVLDVAACEVERRGDDLTLRDRRTGVRIRPSGQASHIFERALQAARTAEVVPPALLGALTAGPRPIEGWRAPAADRELLWCIVADDQLTSTVRVGAADALRAGELTSAERAKLIDIAHAAKDPFLVNALEYPDERTALR